MNKSRREFLKLMGTSAVLACIPASIIPQGNVFESPEAIAKEALKHLEENLILCKCGRVHTESPFEIGEAVKLAARKLADNVDNQIIKMIRKGTFYAS